MSKKPVSLPVVPISEKQATTGARDLGVPRPLSASAVETLHKCGFKWAFRYLLHSPDTGGAASAIGTSYHEALRLMNSDWKRGKLKPRTVTLRRYEERFKQQLKAEAKKLRPEERNRIDATVPEVRAILNDWFNQLRVRVEPHEVGLVEQNQLYSVGGIPVRVIIDLLLPDRVLDYKSSASTRKVQWERRFQFKLYAVVAQRSKVEVVKLARHGKSSGIELEEINYQMPKIAKEVEWTLRAAVNVISKRAFTPPDPESWFCSSKWCDHWKRCRGGTFAKELS